MGLKIEAENYLEELIKVVKQVSTEQIADISQILQKAFTQGKNIYICGNGGSAATASHFVCDLNKGTLGKDPKTKEKRFKAFSLNDAIPTMLAYANDESYEDVFSEPLKNLVLEGDIVIGISASGNSENVVRALKVAKNANAITIGFIGFDGGSMKDLVDSQVFVPSHHYGIVEDIHVILTHLLTDQLKKFVNEQQ